VEVDWILQFSNFISTVLYYAFAKQRPLTVEVDWILQFSNVISSVLYYAFAKQRPIFLTHVHGVVLSGSLGVL